MFAETIQIGTGEAILILLLVFGVPLVSFLLLVMGSIHAWRAGKGNPRSVRLATGIVVFEVLAALALGGVGTTANLSRGPSGFFAGAILLQTICFAIARVDDTHPEIDG